MSGITHEWNGTVLTITSDSGTSSCDLKGDKGDDGVRGTQGPAGKDGSSNLKVDDTLSVEGAVAEAKTVGDKFAEMEEAIANASGAVESVNGYTGAVVLTASDVNALPADTVIPSTSGLATETYVDNAISTVNTAISQKQNKVYYNSSQPADWVNGDIWLQPAT